jgi:hypothetical protein
VLARWRKKKSATSPDLSLIEHRSVHEQHKLPFEMNPNDNDEERLIRIEHMLELLQKDSAVAKRIAAKVIDAIVEAAPAEAAATPPPHIRRSKPEGFRRTAVESGREPNRPATSQPAGDP